MTEKEIREQAEIMNRLNEEFDAASIGEPQPRVVDREYVDHITRFIIILGEKTPTSTKRSGVSGR